MRRADQRVELVLLQQPVDAVRPGGEEADLRAPSCKRDRSRPLVFSALLEQLLPEQRHFLPRVRLVERDHVGQRAHRDRRRAARQIGVEPGLELGQQDLQLVACRSRLSSNFLISTSVAPRSPQDRERGLERGVGAEAGREAHHADALALERLASSAAA